MKLIKKAQSKLDKTIKYIFEAEGGLIVEYSYIDNGSDKDIICVPCQTMCNMKCTFCHLTDHLGKIKVNNLSSTDIDAGVMTIIDDLNLKGDRPLLISYMGCGEPLANIKNVIMSMRFLMKFQPNIRFGMATMLPKSKWLEFFHMTEEVKRFKIPLKVHLSLHFTNDKNRLEWMPSALDIKPSLVALNFYHIMTNNPTEVHYTLMDGVNDSESEIDVLHTLIPSFTTIKLMRYSTKESLEVEKVAADKVNSIINQLQTLDPARKVEYYEPPGIDIGASCGQFLLDDVLEKKVETVNSSKWEHTFNGIPL